MPKMIKIGILLTTIFLFSCGKKIPPIEPMVLCSMNVASNYCRCSCYDLKEVKTVNPEKCLIESPTDFWRQPLIDCQNFAGFAAKDWTLKIIPYLKDAKMNAHFVEKHQEDTVKEILENLPD